MCECVYITVIEKYQYRAPEDLRSKNKVPDIKDFRRLNKVVLKEGATNAAVSPVPFDTQRAKMKLRKVERFTVGSRGSELTR